MISIKSKSELVIMRRACEIVALTHEKLEEALCSNITTGDLDRIAEEFIRKCDALPSFKGYKGVRGVCDYPASICTSINEEVVHGIPGKRVIKDGDIVSIDIGAYYKGYHGDSARTFYCGKIKDTAKKLIEATEQSFFEGIKAAVLGSRVVDISARIQNHVESNGFSVVRDYVGHGIGREMHEEPQVPNFKTKEKGPRLVAGMTLAIEPMVNEGNFDVRVLDNKWTVVTCDGKLSSHYENTIVITENEPIVLTKLD